MQSFLSRVLLTATLFSLSPALAQAQSNEQSKNPTPRWLVNCSNQANPDVLACSMSQSIIRAETRQRIVTATIFRNQSGAALMRLHLPHGLNLNHGVTVSIDDGSASQHTINTADANGAYAVIALSNELANAMRGGNIANIGLKNLSGNDINLQISLQGFSAAYNLMNR